MAEAFVLDDSGVANTLFLAEDTVGKRVTSPSDLQAPIRKVVKINVFTAQAFRQLTALQDDLLPVVRHSQLFADVTLFAVTQDIVQPVSNDVERAMKVVRF